MNPTTTSSGARPLFAVVLPNILAGWGSRRCSATSFPKPTSPCSTTSGPTRPRSPTATPTRFTSTEEFVLHREAFRRERRTILLRRTPSAGHARHRPLCRREERLVHALMRSTAARPPRGPRHGGASHPPGPGASGPRNGGARTHRPRTGEQNRSPSVAGIGVTTVVSHRRNLMEKLPGIKSVAGLTLHAPCVCRRIAPGRASLDRHKSYRHHQAARTCATGQPPESPAATRSQALLACGAATGERNGSRTCRPRVTRPDLLFRLLTRSGLAAACPTLGARLRTACFFSSSRAPTRRRMSDLGACPRPASPPPLSSSRSPPAASLEIEDCRTAKKILTLHPETKKTDPAPTTS